MRAARLSVDEVVAGPVADSPDCGGVTVRLAVHRLGTVKITLPEPDRYLVRDALDPVDIENQQPVGEALREEGVVYRVMCPDISDHILNPLLSIGHYRDDSSVGDIAIRMNIFAQPAEESAADGVGLLSPRRIGLS